MINNGFFEHPPSGELTSNLPSRKTFIEKNFLIFNFFPWQFRDHHSFCSFIDFETLVISARCHYPLRNLVSNITTKIRNKKSQQRTHISEETLKLLPKTLQNSHFKNNPFNCHYTECNNKLLFSKNSKYTTLVT